MLSYGKEVDEEKALLLILSEVAKGGTVYSSSFFPELSAKVVNELARRTPLITVECKTNRETYLAPAGVLVDIVKEAAAMRTAARNRAADIIAEGEAASRDHISRALFAITTPAAVSA